MTTINEWVEAFRNPNLTIGANGTFPGVGRYYDAPPESIDLTSGPVAYPWIIGFNDGDFQYSCAALNEVFTMNYEIITEAVAQSTLGNNYQLVIDTMDAAIPQIRAMTIKNFMSFTADIITRPVGNQDNWAVRFIVSGTDKL